MDNISILKLVNVKAAKLTANLATRTLLELIIVSLVQKALQEFKLQAEDS